MDPAERAHAEELGAALERGRLAERRRSNRRGLYGCLAIAAVFVGLIVLGVVLSSLGIYLR